MRIGKTVLALVITMLMLAAPVTLAADVEGSASVTGKVTVQASTPTVSFEFYSDSDYTTPTTQFTPQETVYMKITVSGGNPLEEYTITVKMFADNDNTAVGSPPANTSPEKYVTFTISYNGNAWTLTTDTGGSSTWEINLDPNKAQPNPASASGSFYLTIKFGKTAREANTDDNAVFQDWDVVVTATVAGGQASGSAEAYGYTVFFYSEVTTTASTIDFGTLKAGESETIQYVDGTIQDHFTITVIANGVYDLKAITTSTWDDGNGHTITLATTSPGEGEFSLLVDDDSDLTTDAVYVTTDLNTANPFVDDASPTTETGASHNIYMQISLGTNIHTGTYQGTITLYAVDGS